MSLFGSDNRRRRKSHRKQIGRVRYVGWEDWEKPEPQESEDGDNVFTSRDADPRPKRRKSISGPSGHQYKFRGLLGRASQWLPVYSIEDLDAFREADEYEVKRES